MSPEKNKNDFMRLFLANQNIIFAYLMMHVPNRLDVEDLMQETAVWMWENFNKFTPGTSFSAWGVQVARYKILNLSRAKKNSRIKFHPDVVELINEKADSILNETDQRVDALQKCLAKLSVKDRKLLYLKYENSLTVKRLAELVGRPARGLYKTMSRVHKNLLQCVRHSLVWEAED